jgi:DNA-binding transcriptional LysR family regulator
MELYQLNTFVTVARTCNVTRAATELNTTPPSVSNHIKLLENDLGVTLFTRTSKGMEITSQGKTLLLKASDILNASNELLMTAKSMQGDIEGNILFGINADSHFLKISSIIHSIFKNHPDIKIQIVTSSTDEIIQLVESGKMDCGFAFGKQNNRYLSSIFLSDVALEIAIPIQYLEEYQHASLKEIVTLPWIVPANRCPFLEEIKSYLDLKGYELTKQVFANDDITKHAFIDKGIAISVLEQFEAKKLVDMNKVFLWKSPKSFKSTLSYIYQKKRSDDLLLQTVQAFVLNAWKG